MSVFHFEIDKACEYMCVCMSAKCCLFLVLFVLEFSHLLQSIHMLYYSYW